MLCFSFLLTSQTYACKKSQIGYSIDDFKAVIDNIEADDSYTKYSIEAIFESKSDDVHLVAKLVGPKKPHDSCHYIIFDIKMALNCDTKAVVKYKKACKK